MPVENKHRFIKILIIVGVVLLAYLVFAGSKAETEPEHHYTSEFETPDPNGDIYEWLETQEPYYPDEPEFSFSPIPLPTDAPYEINGYPFNVQLKYDPFLVYPAGSFYRWKRLNGTQATYVPPIPYSSLHGVSPTVTSYTSGDDYIYKYAYSFSPSGVNQTSTEHTYQGASLVYVLVQQFDTVQSARQITKGDTVHIEFAPKITFNTTDLDYMYSPTCNYYIAFTFNSVDNTLVYKNITDTQYGVPLLNNGDDIFSFDYEYDQSGAAYLAGYEIFLTINPMTDYYLGLEGVRGEVSPAYYYFNQIADPYLSLIVTHTTPAIDRIGGFFNNLISHISSVFVPNETQIQNWIDAHMNDTLDNDNVMNVVSDLYINLANLFSGHNPTGRPVLDIPALSFNIQGYGKVTPFEGYTYDMSANTPVDGSGRSLWYYVKLANSVALSSGLIALIFRYFRKWYDLHFSS